MADVERAVTPVFKYPAMRLALIDTIQTLADRKHQQRVWIDHINPHGAIDDFDQVVHFLFDDTTLTEDARGCIGYYVADEKEADSISSVTGAIQALLDEMGTRCSDAEYLSNPLWRDVVAAATAAARMMGVEPRVRASS